jgi:hypothetical protein
MLRAAVAAKTQLGMEAKAAMESGALVTDDLVVRSTCQLPLLYERYLCCTDLASVARTLPLLDVASIDGMATPFRMIPSMIKRRISLFGQRGL